MSDKNDDFGNRMKELEAHETGRTFMSGLPVYIRLDGRGFSKFTRTMARPYDVRMSNLMIALTEYLVKETNARIGYTQSDEVSLILHSDDHKSETFFNRKVMKLTSVLAGMASSFFAIKYKEYFPGDLTRLESRMPHFDCRALQMPSKGEATNMILWRAMDAKKNSVSMAAHHHFSHKSLQGCNQAKMQERLFQEKGINFNDYPRFFKQGTFISRKIVEQSLPQAVLDRIKDKTDVTTYLRTVVEPVEMPAFNKVTNRVEVIFDGATPEVANEPVV